MTLQSNQPASPESREALYKNMGKHIELFYPLLQKTIPIIKALQKLPTKTQEDKLVLALFELQAFIATVNLDIATFLRAEFRSEHSSEKRMNIRYINVVVIEGYKYLKAYCEEDRANAKWEQIRILARELQDLELSAGITTIDKLIAEFQKTYIHKTDIYNRNLAIHYDKNPFKIYEYYINLNEDIEVKRINNFFEIIDALICFLSKYIAKANIKLCCEEVSMITDHSLIERINSVITREHTIFGVAGRAIETYSKILNKMAMYSKMPEYFSSQIGRKFNIDKNALTKELCPIISDIKPGILVIFIYLDLCTAVRAYLTSESHYEKQLNLRHIEIIVYEGCRHLYGFDDRQRSRSFWQTALFPALQNSEDSSIKELLEQIQNGLEKISLDDTINNCLLRECFVHYRYESRDNIIALFEESEKSIAVFEFNKAKLLLEVLPKIIEVNAKILSLKNQSIKEENRKKREELITTLRMPLDKIADKQKKEEYETMLQPIIDLITKIYS
ncbi:MAG: hypothetical protein Q4F50_05695 [Bacteroides sp.]|uniref:hypothetical protein n=1 Tax=Bacteroides sp. TaxID=29523 RepID=UPI0026E0ED54|nr:hypothetical protein [Bacteroides sp.]MDO5419539.1 hypothetical protein [Bacteroides sp.]